MNLCDVNRGIEKHKKRKRVAGAPARATARRAAGHKGQGQLAGWSAAPISKAVLSPLIRRIPKAGSTTPGPRSWRPSTSATWTPPTPTEKK